MKCAPISLSRLLLGGLCMVVLSACAQTIQPWVQPDVSQKMKRLQIENYLLKHDLANYRKKLMQANIGKRKLARKIQNMRGANPRLAQNTIRQPARPKQQFAMQKPAQTAPVSGKQKSLLTTGSADKPAQRSTMQKQAKQAPAPQKPTPKPSVSAAHQAPSVASSKPTAETPQIDKQVVGEQTVAKQDIGKQIVGKKTVSKAVTENKLETTHPQDWKLKKRLFFGSGHKGTSPAMRRQIDAFAKSLPPAAKIHVAGYSDGEPVGGFSGKTHQSSHELADNKAVSLERGMAVVRALMAAGIDIDRIQVAGFGATKPLATNDTAEGRAKNRRVEIFIAEPETTERKPAPAPSVNPVQQEPATVSSEPEPAEVIAAKIVAVKTITSKVVSEPPAKITPVQGDPTQVAAAQTVPTQQNAMKMRLFFDMGQKWTSPEMRRQLRTFANALPPTAKLRIVGHADGLPVHQPSASLADNQAMSLARAKSVFRGLKAYGVHAERMQVEGFAATRPLASNDTPEGRAKNRRVEIFIIE